MISPAGVLGLPGEGNRGLEDGDAHWIMQLNGEGAYRDCLT